MNKLLKTKNALKITAIGVEKPSNFTANIINEFRKTRYRLLVCKSGMIYVNIGGKETKLIKNNLIILSPNMPSVIKASDGELYDIIVFDAFIGKILNFTNKVLKLDSFSGSVFKELINSFSFATQKNIDVDLAISQLAVFLNAIRYEGQTIKQKADDRDVFSEAVTFIKENLDKELSISSIAAYLCVSPSKLKRAFYKHSALSVHKFMLTIKIEKAKTMLRQGSTSKEVSRSLGFDNQNYFSAVFKRETGKSPSEFKAE